MRAGTPSSSGEVAVVLIGLMLQALLEHMSHSSAPVTPQDVIRRVTAQGNAAGIRLGEVRRCQFVINVSSCVTLGNLFVLPRRQFKGIMLSMLGANVQELQLHTAMVRIIRGDLVVLHRQKIAKLVTAWPAGLFYVLCCKLGCVYVVYFQRKYCCKGEEGLWSQEAVLGAGFPDAEQRGAPPQPPRKMRARDYQQVWLPPLCFSQPGDRVFMRLHDSSRPAVCGVGAAL